MRMLLTINLSIDEAIALKRFRNGQELPSLEAAAERALREYLSRTGHLKLFAEFHEDSEVAGTA